MRPNPQFPAHLVTVTEEIVNGKFYFVCSARIASFYMKARDYLKDFVKNCRVFVILKTKSQYLCDQRIINCHKLAGHVRNLSVKFPQNALLIKCKILFKSHLDSSDILYDKTNN